MKSLLLIGCGGHARSLIDVIEADGQWLIHGLIGLSRHVGTTVHGYPVLGTDADLPDLYKDCPFAVLAVGQLPSAQPRRRLAGLLTQFGFSSPVFVSPHAVVSRHAKIGPGSVVGHGAIINAGASVGSHCIINTRSLIEHDADLGDYCHISTGALINGGVRVGSGSFIGSGAIIRECLQLPAGTIVSAGKRVMGWPLL